MFMFILRGGTMLLTFVSVFMMAFAIQHLKISTCSASFIYFLASNGLVFVYSLLAIVSKAKYSASNLLVPMVDVIAIAVLFTSFGAACAVIFSISTFAMLVSIAIAMTLLSSVAYVLLFAVGVMAIHDHDSDSVCCS